MERTRIVFRADGNSDIGLGHVIRSLALAEMLKQDFECVFFIQDPAAGLQEQIEKICGSVIKLPFLPSDAHGFVHELHAHLKGNEIVVLDGYKFRAAYQKRIKDRNCQLVCIDDIHQYHFVSDAIINHAGAVSRKDYSLEPYTQCYFGLDYALLRSAFLKKRKEVPTNSRSVKKLFVNMGGADPNNDTCKILPFILKHSYFQTIHVVTGAAYKHKAALEELLKTDPRLVAHHDLNGDEMAKLMQECGTAVCPPSSVAMEYASIGGLLFLKLIADNQKAVKRYFLEEHLALDFDNDFERTIHTDTTAACKNIMDNQHKKLDGKSDERLRALFHKLEIALQLFLRPVSEDDVRLCFDWANDPEVRKNSYNSNPIPWQDHISWFSKKLKDNTARFYIVEYKGKSVGQIRFEGNEEKTISYLLSSEMRGKGLATILLLKGIKQVTEESAEVKKISGYVKRSNIASCKAFDKAGFAPSPADEHLYPDSIKYELDVPLRQNTF